MLPTRKCLGLSISLGFVIGCSTQIRAGEAAAAPIAPPAASAKSNGINVGRAKIYDNRTLTLMLEGLSEELRNKQFFDQASLAKALGYFQGSRSQESVSTLSVSTLPIPGVTHDVTNTTGMTSGTESSDTASAGTTSTTSNTAKQTGGSSGNLVDKTTTTQAAIAPQLPTLDSLTALSAMAPTYGEQSGDLLNDQVNLTYQIFNLRMLLERSLSDRLLHYGKPRLQAVVGFNISIDPAQIHTDAAAVVEITVERAEGSEPDGMSLVSLMPQEKTYNATALSSKSNAYGGTAVAKVVQVGYNQRNRDQTFYLYRDSDTIAFERPAVPSASNKVTFGWVFRPVLGRRSTSPERRQLFAVLALPDADEPPAAGKTANEAEKVAAALKKLKIGVHTFWRKFDRDTMTTFTDDDSNRRTKALYFITAGLARPLYLNGKSERFSDYELDVPPTNIYQERLGPDVRHVWWTPVGTKSALVTAEGQNFFTGTQVALGDKLYATPADGLTIRSIQTMELLAPLDAVASGPATVMGRYGKAIALLEKEPQVSSPAAEGGEADLASLPRVEIATVHLGPSLSGSRVLELALKQVDPVRHQSIDLTSAGLPKSSPLVTVNGRTFVPPYEVRDEFREIDNEPQADDCNPKADDSEPKADGNKPSPPATVKRKVVTLKLDVADTLIGPVPSAAVRIAWPFRGAQWTASKRLYDPITEFQIIRLAANAILLKRTREEGFTEGFGQPPLDKDHPPTPGGVHWQMFVGAKGYQLVNPKFPSFPGDCVSTAVSKNILLVKMEGTESIPDRIVLVPPPPYQEVYALDVPKAPAADAKKLEVNQFDSVWLNLEVKDAFAVAQVTAHQLALEFPLQTAPKDPNDPVKVLPVKIPDTMTAQAHDFDITIATKDGKSSNVRVHVAPSPFHQK